MLSTAPGARPDLEVILKKPFVKRHVAGFFADVSSRPADSVSDATMAVQLAVNRGNSGGGKDDLKPEAESLRKQLQSLGLNDLIRDNSAKSNGSNPLNGPPSSAKAAVAAARQQSSALRREEDRRSAVESALDRLKGEREMRARNARALRERQQERDAARAAGVPRQRRAFGAGGNLNGGGGGGRAVGGNNGVGGGGGLPDRGPRAQPSKAAHQRRRPGGGGGVGGGGAVLPQGGWRPYGADAIRDRRRGSGDAIAPSDPRDVAKPPGMRGEGRQGVPPASGVRGQAAPRDWEGEAAAASAQAAQAAQKAGAARERERLAEAARREERREQERARERMLQLAEIEKLKEAKVELDRREKQRRSRAELKGAKGDDDDEAYPGGTNGGSGGAKAVGADSTQQQQTLLVQTRNQATLLDVPVGLPAAGASPNSLAAGPTTAVAPGNDATLLSATRTNNATLQDATLLRASDEDGPPNPHIPTADAAGAPSRGREPVPFDPFTPQRSLARDDPPPLAEAKATRLAHASNRSRRGDSPNSGRSASLVDSARGGGAVSTRDRVLRAKAERSEAEQEGRRRELVESMGDALQQRAQAKDLHRKQYESALDRQPYSTRPTVVARANSEPVAHSEALANNSPGSESIGQIAEPKEPVNIASLLEPHLKDDEGSAPSLSSKAEVADSLNADELLAKLQDESGSGGKFRLQVVDESGSGSALGGGAETTGGGARTDFTEASHIESDDLRSSSDGDDSISDFNNDSGRDDDNSDQEGAGWARPELGEGEGQDAAEEDLAKRQAALEEELKTCTLRVDELRKTLHQTRSFIKARTSPSSMRDPGARPVRHSPAAAGHESGGSGATGGEDNTGNLDDEVECFLEEEDEDSDDFGSVGTANESEEEEELHANSALIREATDGVGPGLHHLNIPPPLAPVTPKRQPIKPSSYAWSPPEDVDGSSSGAARELSDAPSPMGRLADRIKVLRQRCIEGLGEEAFERAHRYLKAMQDAEDAGVEFGGEGHTSTDAKLADIMGPHRVHFSSLIDQLIFMEDTLLD